LKRIILFNPKELFDKEGSLKKISDLPFEVAAAISSIDLIETNIQSNLKQISKIKFYNKLDALEKLAKHLGFYEKDNKQKIRREL